MSHLKVMLRYLKSVSSYDKMFLVYGLYGVYGVYSQYI